MPEPLSDQEITLSHQEMESLMRKITTLLAGTAAAVALLGAGSSTLQAATASPDSASSHILAVSAGKGP